MQINRRFVRWQINSKARIRLEAADEFVDCRISDISYMGCQIATDQKLCKDAFLEFTLALSDDFLIRIEAWVVWHRIVEGRNIYGLFFTKIRDLDKEQVFRFISRYYPGQIEAKWWEGIDMDSMDIEAQQEKGGAQMDDRRIFERFAVSFPVSFLNQENSCELCAQTRDISAKGMGITSSEELKPRTQVELWLKIPDNSEPLYARGEVAWCKKDAAGYMAGINLEKADLMGLSRILRVA